MKKVFLSILLALSACDPYAVIPNQDRALDLVWNHIYSAQKYTPPQVEWIVGDRLVCADGAGFYYSYGDKKDICVGGLYWPSQNLAQIAHYPDNDSFKFSGSSFSHEHWHAYLDRIGIPSIDHTDPGFATGGIVELANDILIKDGL